MEYEEAVPVQPFAVGVTVMVADMADVVVLVAVKLGTFPVPLVAARPIFGFELVQVMVAPEGILVKLDEDTVAPEHTVKFAGTTTVTNGLTVIV